MKQTCSLSIFDSYMKHTDYTISQFLFFSSRYFNLRGTSLYIWINRTVAPFAGSALCQPKISNTLNLCISTNQLACSFEFSLPRQKRGKIISSVSLRSCSLPCSWPFFSVAEKSKSSSGDESQCHAVQLCASIHAAAPHAQPLLHVTCIPTRDEILKTLERAKRRVYEIYLPYEVIRQIERAARALRKRDRLERGVIPLRR